ncbi:hypothetical protein E6Q11_01115 [Candidatus Dojkabacteria bacterium]|uniref:Uncharacterized protein n=1 Tax=Candidatus Dojkabacteria bacterium TaxID=2099670 RepID=A0A5C7JA91_9BACT|nr:MAG: hypothetical protein E6Q11_01115 [Candidatus Dojkabacteria bacterium]
MKITLLCDHTSAELQHIPYEALINWAIYNKVQDYILHDPKPVKGIFVAGLVGVVDERSSKYAHEVALSQQEISFEEQLGKPNKLLTEEMLAKITKQI